MLAKLLSKEEIHKRWPDNIIPTGGYKCHFTDDTKKLCGQTFEVYLEGSRCRTVDEHYGFHHNIPECCFEWIGTPPGFFEEELFTLE